MATFFVLLSHLPVHLLLEFECHLDLQIESSDNVAAIEWRMNIQTKQTKQETYKYCLGIYSIFIIIIPGFTIVYIGRIRMHE